MPPLSTGGNGKAGRAEGEPSFPQPTCSILPSSYNRPQNSVNPLLGVARGGSAVTEQSPGCTKPKDLGKER